MRAGAAPAQINPDLLGTNDSWWWYCQQPHCNVETQGGLPGLEAHTITVHGEDLLPFGKPGRRP